MTTYFEYFQYSATQLNPHVYHIHDATIANPPGLHEDGSFNNPSSIYVIIDKTQALVIDLGNPYEDNHLRELVDKIIENRQLKVAITHNHFDHLGSLKQFMDCPIYYCGKDPIEVGIPLQTGDQITLDTFCFEVYEVPGHTAGSLAFLEKNRGWFATGDAFGSSYVWLLFMENVLDVYKNTLETILPILKGIKNLYFLCGHRYQQQHTAVPGIHPLSPKNPNMDYSYLEDMYVLVEKIQNNTATYHEFEAFGRKDLRAYTYKQAEIDTYIPHHPCIKL